MRIAEDWGELMFDLHCLSKGSAKRQFRQDIRYSFGGLCAYCRVRRANTIDHLKPRTAGGSDLRSNLLPCCVECNHSKGSELNWLEWFQRQQFYNEVARDLIIEWSENRRTGCIWVRSGNTVSSLHPRRLLSFFSRHHITLIGNYRPGILVIYFR